MPEPDAPVLVVTRPAPQAEALASRLMNAGYAVIAYPVLEIVSCQQDVQLQLVLRRLHDFDLAIFISANAVTQGLAAVQKQREWPTQLDIAAIGQATARALHDQHRPAKLIAPPPYDSEALLSLPEMQQLRDRQVIIFRGHGGREYLAQSLREMGARVEYANCYKRQRPIPNNDELCHAWDAQQALVFIVTSNQGLENLFRMIPATYRQQLINSTFIVVSKRMQQQAQAMDIQGPILVAAAASDDAVMEQVEDIMVQVKPV